MSPSTGSSSRHDARLDIAAARQMLLGDYRPLPGVRDELCDADGRLRAPWTNFVDALARLGRAEVARRFGAADRYLRDSGVYYRVYDEAAGRERPWPLAHLPLLIDGAEWRDLVAGLVQRADLLEAVLADAYGAARLVSDGRLPAAVVTGSRDFLRPMVGARPRGGRFLRFYAAEVGRGPDGRWWVLGDRAQAPSGVGYALENRIAMTRALSDLFEAFRVERLAGFFQAFRSDLTTQTGDDARICLLTPGPLNDTYFEHALLARYLGFTLVEGGDLTVRDNAVHIRTVAGLQRADVVWRRLDADWADPLELDTRSRIGVPGLVQVARNGGVTLVNALGTGLLESRALLSFLPSLAPHVLGAPLTLPNVATWWCGQPLEREAVIADLDALVIASAFEHATSGSLRHGPVGTATLDAAERAKLIAAIRRRGIDYVAHENIKLSTTPAWTGQRLEPRPFVLRVFLARVDDRWTVMPGGFARVGEHADARAVSLQRGGSAADVWVLADAPVAPVTLLPQPDRVEVRRSVGPLPSRAADNLFWLGRYIERAEATLRILRILASQLSEPARAAAGPARRFEALLAMWGALDESAERLSLSRAIARALNAPSAAGSVLRLAGAALSAASVIRDRFSPDAWRTLNDLEALAARNVAADVTGSDLLDRINQALRLVAAFSGLAQENMNQLAGWHFLDLGRRIERAIAMCRVVRQLVTPGSGADTFDALLEYADSQITYRQRYVMVAARAPVIDLVVLEPSNPRAVAFQVRRLDEHLAALPAGDDTADDPRRIVMRLIAMADAINIDQLDDRWLMTMERTLMDLSDAISQCWLNNRDAFAASEEGAA